MRHANMKVLCRVLAILMVVSMTACAGTSSPPSSSAAPTPTASIPAVVPSQAAADPVVSGSYNIATASIGGAYYPFGQEIANLVEEFSGGLSMIPEVTGGATENPRLVAAGDCDFAMTNENVGVAALAGTGDFAGLKLDALALGRLYPSVFHIVSLQGSNINTIADLKGKRVAVGPAGGGTLPILNALLSYYGMDVDNDFVASYLPYTDGFTQLSDGNIDAAIALGGYPNSAVLEISTTKKIQLVSIEDDVWSKFLTEYPYYSKTLVSRDFYNTPDDSYLIGIPNVLICRADISDDVVYMVTKSIFDHIAEFQAVNANARDLSTETAALCSIPFHPGAIRYFKERGYDVG